METTSFEEWVKLAGATGIGTMALALVSRTLFGKLVEQGASNAIIGNMREELQRLSQMNAELSAAFAKQQSEILELRRKNTELESEVHRLKVEIDGDKQ